MEIAVVTVEIRTGHSPKESKALPFKLAFWGLCSCNTTKELPVFINFRWEFVFMTHGTNEQSVFVIPYSEH